MTCRNSVKVSGFSPDRELKAARAGLLSVLPRHWVAGPHGPSTGSHRDKSLGANRVVHQGAG